MTLQPTRVHAGWWSHAPADFEDCADAAEKAATKEAKASALSACNAKFAGRRKAGGGYSYYDFMQNRSFDIAGPNPTPEEQKHIDEQYTVFLEQERRDSIAAAFAAKQQQQLQPAAFKSETEKIPLPLPLPLPAPAPRKREIASADTKADIKTRAKLPTCAQHDFSCEWPRLSESIKDLKKALFGSTAASKNRHG